MRRNDGEKQDQPSKHFYRETRDMRTNEVACFDRELRYALKRGERADANFKAAMMAAHPDIKRGMAKAAQDTRTSAFYVPIYSAGSNCGSPAALCAEGGGNG